MGRKRKEITLDLTVRFVPLPQSKRAAFEHAFDLLADLLFAEIEIEQEVERGTVLSLAQPANAG